MVQGREQRSMLCWGTRLLGLPNTFMADLLCIYSACFQEKHSYRASAFPASVSLWACDHSLEKLPKRWGGCGLGGSLAWLSSSVVTASFLFKGGAVEDSGEAGVLLRVSGWVECLHYSPGVAGPSPSLRWCWGRTAQPCLWNCVWAFASGSGYLYVRFFRGLSHKITYHRKMFFPLKTYGNWLQVFLYSRFSSIILLKRY